MCTLEPDLIPIGPGGYIRMLLNVGAALSVTKWDGGKTDDKTGLSTGTKDEGRFDCAFFWSDAQGNEVEPNKASHLAVVVGGQDASEQDCLREQKLLTHEIEAARDGSFEDLGMFNH